MTKPRSPFTPFWVVSCRCPWSGQIWQWFLTQWVPSSNSAELQLSLSVGRDSMCGTPKSWTGCLGHCTFYQNLHFCCQLASCDVRKDIGLMTSNAGRWTAGTINLEPGKPGNCGTFLPQRSLHRTLFGLVAELVQLGTFRTWDESCESPSCREESLVDNESFNVLVRSHPDIDCIIVECVRESCFRPAVGLRSFQFSFKHSIIVISHHLYIYTQYI